MYLKSNILYLHAETPLHVGAGSGLGAIDLPIQRERPTSYPMIQASGIKGALRDALRTEPAPIIEAVFGPDPGENGTKAHAGAFSPGDGRILLFPVRSLKGVFAWVTSANILQRWARDIEDVTDLSAELNNFTGPASTDQVDYCFASSSNVVTNQNYVILEDFAFKNQANEKIQGITKKLADRVFASHLDPYWKELLKTNLVILPDDAFTDFVKYATEVVTRTRLEPDTKTVVRGALWNEEHLPMETVLYTPIRATRVRMNEDDIPAEFSGEPEEQAQKVLDWLKEKLGKKLQLGGDETVGRGLVNLNWES